jgi:hypothetical protein
VSKIYVTEFAGSDINSAKFPPIAEQTVTFTSASVQCSNAFNALTRLIRVNTSAICSISIGKNPTATADTLRMAANTTEYFSVEGGFKIAAIDNT